MYSQCGHDTPPKNCFDNKPARVSTDPEVISILKNTCPHLLHDNDTRSEACCDILQLRTLSTQLQAARNLLERCPACLKNFIQLWCEFTCSTNQSMFTNVMTDGHGKGVMVDFYLTPRFAEGLFKSCRNVNFPGSNGKVLDLMCGTTADKCTPQKWLDFLGSPPEAPFKISMYQTQMPVHPNATAGDVIPSDAGLIHCNETFVDLSTGKNTSACSCQDCESSCPSLPHPPKAKKVTYIAGVPQYVFFVIISYVLFAIVFIVISCFTISGRKRSPSVSLNNYGSVAGQYPEPKKVDYGGQKNHGFFVRCGANMEKHMRAMFQAWGTWCAFHPWTVIISCLAIVAALSSGLVFFKVITDPVDLWSATKSDAREQRKYFDKQFGPFYRTEQVIITAKPRNETYLIYPRDEPAIFDGIIHNAMLHKVNLYELHLKAWFTPVRLRYSH